MKRRSIPIIFILILIALIVYMIKFPSNKIDLPYTADNPSTQQDTKEEPKQNILDIQKQIEEQLRKEQEVKAENERLERLQNPELITSNLREVGILITYQGEVTYKDKIVQKGFLNKRELYINILYQFGIGINLNKIEVGKIVGDIVTINIPKVAMQVEYLKILPKETTINGTKSAFAKQFKPSEIEFVYETAQDTTLSKINNTPEIFDNAYENLENNLRNLIMELGYKKVYFKEMTN
jgi:hypothetical protein